MALRTRVLVWLATWALFAIVALPLIVPRQFLILPQALFLPLGVPAGPGAAVAGWLVYMAHAWVTLTRAKRRSFWLSWMALPVLLAYNVGVFAIAALQGLR